MNKQVPPIGIGHVYMDTDCMDDSVQFMRSIGMRSIFEGSEISVMEMRGGTHLIIKQVESHSEVEAQFDLMVEDLRTTKDKLDALGFSTSDIQSVPTISHEIFTVKEPGKNIITIFSSHISKGAV